MRTEPGPGPTEPTIEFTTIPAYGSYLKLKGLVRNVDTEQFRVAVYIRVHGGWWNKPYWDAPITAISADGSFSVDITTGGQDEQASEIAAFVVPDGYQPPGLRGETELPAELLRRSVGHAEAARSA